MTDAHGNIFSNKLKPVIRVWYLADWANTKSLGRLSVIINGGHSSIHFNNRANAYRELGQYSEALIDYDEAIRLFPTQADTYLNKGMALTRMKRYKEAMDCFAKGEQSMAYHRSDKEKAEKAR